MKKSMAIVIVTILTGLAANVMSAENDLNVSVDVKGGSRLVGTANLESAQFIATYGTMEMAMREIKTIEVNPDHETMKIVMINGDSLQGVLALNNLVIRSLVGDIDIRLVHITKITINHPEPPTK